jgi:hypothetical protein
MGFSNYSQEDSYILGELNTDIWLAAGTGET